MSITVHVDLGKRAYDILVGSHLSIGRPAAEPNGTRCLIVSDSNVDLLYGEPCQQMLVESGFSTERVVVPAGEDTKDLRWVSFIYDRAVEAGLDRSSVVVALGGGVVGDLAGFVAATYLRGIRLIQVPTTLLAMVDSSVGGKTGVNLAQGKNLVGAFHQPIEVVADLRMLATLPEREYVSGLAEVVKYGVIWDAAFFKELEHHADQMLRREPAFLEKTIGRCCEIKAEVVSMDEHEVGPRAILNFGHTLAHALEKVSGYGALLHGEAVAVGMAFAGALSVRLKAFPANDLARLIDLLARLGLPTRWGGGAEGRAASLRLLWPELREAIRTDKKTVKGMPRFVLATRLGAVTTGCEVPECELMEAWNVGGK